jgi:hypothetical protein
VVLGLAGSTLPCLARAEEPPRVVLVESARVGVESQTQVLSSTSNGWKTVPSSGSLASPRPEAVLGASASRPPPTDSATVPRPAAPPAQASTDGDILSSGIVSLVAGVVPSALSSEQTRSLATSALTTLPPDQLVCLQKALGRGIATGLISADRPSLGTSEMLWLARECNVDTKQMAAVLSHALAGPSARSAPQPAGSAAQPAPAVGGGARSPADSSWRASGTDARQAPVPNAGPQVSRETQAVTSEQRVAQMAEAVAHGGRVADAAPRGQEETSGVPGWQIFLLTATGIAGLAGSVYGLTQARRPRYVVRVVRPEPVRLFRPSTSQRSRSAPGRGSGSRPAALSLRGG